MSNTLQERLDTAWDEYGNTIQSIADTEWNGRIKPYLQKNGIAFFQVNGNWWVSKNGDDYHPSDFHPTVMKYKFERGRGLPEILQDEEGQRVLNILEALVGGQSMVSLANYMPSYDPDNVSGIKIEAN